MSKSPSDFFIDGASIYVSVDLINHWRHQGLRHICARCEREQGFKFVTTSICATCEEQMALDADQSSHLLLAR